MVTITAVLGDLTEQNVDTIVNAANTAMRGGGGVDGAIHRAAGPRLLKECIDKFPDGLSTGDAGWTHGHELKAKYVIHTPGPNYAAGQRDPESLRSSYRRSLEVADELGVRTIAFPLISAGIFGWPLEDAINIAVETLSKTPTNVEQIAIVVLDQRKYNLIESLLTSAEGTHRKDVWEFLGSDAVYPLPPAPELEADSAERNQRDRAVGCILASAVGDALGSQYEFGPPLTANTPVVFGVGCFGHGLGEWTDDTSMAVPILQTLADGRSLEDPAELAAITSAWIDWSRDAKDVGSQTRAVFSRIQPPVTEEEARRAALAIHERSGRSAGNGSLMRTGPVALGYLDEGAETALVTAAERVAKLTHWEQDNADACALWCLAIRHAILTGELDVAGQVKWLPAESQQRWHDLIAEATASSATPEQFHQSNGWVVAAFQGALAAVANTDLLVDALESAIRGGGDTDTVAAIAGSLAGALYGVSAVPQLWRERVHGWPGLNADGLEVLALKAIGD